MRRKSFSTWILPKMLREVLRLTSIVKVTPENLRAFCALTDPVAVAWRNIKEYDPVGWSAQLVQASGCGKNIVYERQREWLAKFRVDIAVPYVFFRDLEVLGPNSFAAPETSRRPPKVPQLGRRRRDLAPATRGRQLVLCSHVGAGRDCSDVAADAVASQGRRRRRECVRGLEADPSCRRDASWSSPRAVGQVRAPRADQEVSAPRARPSPQAQTSQALERSPDADAFEVAVMSAFPNAVFLLPKS